MITYVSSLDNSLSSESTWPKCNNRRLVGDGDKLIGFQSKVKHYQTGYLS